MKYFGVVVLIGCLTVAFAMNDEDMEMLKQMSAACVEQTGVSQDLVMKAKDGVFESGPKFPEYLFCMLKTPGFMNEDGDYQIDVIKAVVGKTCGDAIASKIITDCTVFQGDKLEKALETAKCMFAIKSAM